MNYTLHLGDCLDVLRTLPDNSIDAVVCDPPYGLAFMGKRWDYDVPSVEIWTECLRVLKPGGHLLAFAGTRTQHRMAVRIEDAGFEIRDMIAWVYGSGFPKSLDVSKAIDKAAGAEREVVGPGRWAHVKPGGSAGVHSVGLSATPGYDETAPATEAAQQWNGWGTALKPSLETVTVASKPFPCSDDRATVLSSLSTLEARLWLLSCANAADLSFASNPSGYSEACDTARWTAEDVTSTQAALSGQMDTLQFASALNTSLSIVSSWRSTLEEAWGHGSTSTTETESSTTIDLRTLRFSLSAITPDTIIRACSLPGGFSANASTAESYFNASLSLLQSIRTLSATAPAMSRGQRERQGAHVAPSLDPCIMARKPLSGTVAANVLQWGTGALNVDGCRVGGEGVPVFVNGVDRPRDRSSFDTGGSNRTGEISTQGRWPANLIHDGSAEVVGLFPSAADGPSARFFYCPKASKADRDHGCDALPERTAAECVDRTDDSAGMDSPRAGAGRTSGSRNHHPTVKPTDLMRYLCRLVTPPGGTVLDPFVGSGSTGRGAVLEGFGFVGIDRDPEYLAIAEARIAAAVQLRAEELDEAAREAAKPQQLSLF